MTKQLMSYRIEPMMFLENTPSTLRIVPRDPLVAFDDDQSYLVVFLPLDESLEGLGEGYDRFVVSPKNGILYLSYTFRGCQEYYIKVFSLAELGSQTVDLEEDALLSMSVYCLSESLFQLRPYRGDFHCHSLYSDGKESPALVAANYRKAGFDFLAITDHRLYAPSLEAMATYASLPVDLKLFTGEEVHSPDNHIHIINFGGDFSVNALFRQSPALYEREVEEILATLSLPPQINAFSYAACLWVFKKIREGRGLGIFCHPHWVPTVRHVPQAFTDHLFTNHAFDAFELLGGHPPLHNNSQTAMYYDYVSRGIQLPIVGSSDAHTTLEGSENFTEESTIVFSPDNQLPSIIEGVKSLHSVAIAQYHGQAPHIYGPFALVKYSQFLLENYFPLHDELCFEEGRLMMEAALGDENATEILKRLQGRTKRFLEGCFWQKN